MTNEYRVQLIGKLEVLPPLGSKVSYLMPQTIFRALAKFTSNFEPSFTVLCSFNHMGEGYIARLCFPFGSDEEIRKLALHSEILILAGYKILAICRDVKANENSHLKMDDSW